MGLDLGFNRQAAVDAGLELACVPNGKADDVAEAIASSQDPEYIEWLREFSDCIVVPDTDGMLTAESGIGTDIVIRANKWGRVYGPLTRWLKANGIEWHEF
jgi:hypothetical protein